MKKILRAYDYPIFIAVVLLSLFGLVMVYSASMITAVSHYQYPIDYFFQNQKGALILSFIMMVIAMILPYKLYKHKTFLMVMMGGIALLLIIVSIIGHTANNATSWFHIGTRSLQPAEFSKLAIIIYLSAMYGKKQDRINDIDKAVIPPIIFLVGICFLIILQPDYGSAAIILLIAASIILCSGMNLRSLGKLLIIFLLVVGVFFIGIVVTGNISNVFSEERISRFTGLSNPFDNGDEGYQLANSLLAIGSGGITGVGLGDSVQKYGYLPEPHTDFIMAIIAEELGIFGVLFVLGTLGFIVLRGLILSAKCKDPFGSLLLIGISSMIGIQVVINLGGATGLLPITGITLPFISYGGSSLLLLMVSIGVMENVIMRMNLLEQKEIVQTISDNKNM
ncbi:FtsW/RodA/SpoVE family cell cycle protein [Peribacillus frigoritolerans]|uniref:FtsW/RodA/SpoVE family cell cycle protein n=1 Tax=Peribacillus frigoritolerans TaxID=450367 RepID=UPI001F0A3B62|nr:FtsW/RodA/SpoVE family cell cycle protein [Peribacillus frigoritolerans]MCR8872007.1 FtsW/RodA/SpoVE family cell cycle protein [Peribacillus frigoritolerans]